MESKKTSNSKSKEYEDYFEMLKMLEEADEPQEPQEEAKPKYGKSKTVLETIEGKLLTITKPEYLKAFSTSSSKKSACGIFAINENGKKEKVFNIEQPLLAVFAKAYLNYFQKKGFCPNDEIAINWLKIGAELKINKRLPNEKISREEARLDYLLSSVDDFDKLYGKLPISQANFEIISFYRVSDENDIFYFVSPYICELIKTLMQEEELKRSKAKKGVNVEAKNSWCSELLHASVASEKDKSAVEMAKRIIAGLQQRGTLQDGKLQRNKNSDLTPEQKITITYRISVATLLMDCPLFAESVANCKRTDNKNRAIKRHLTNLYNILETKTDLKKFYKELTIKKVFPTTTKISECIEITHKGKLC